MYDISVSGTPKMSNTNIIDAMLLFAKCSYHFVYLCLSYTQA